MENFIRVFFSRLVSLAVFIAGACLLSPVSIFAQELESAESIAQRLGADGFENVQVVRTSEHTLRVALEDNHYRGIYSGLAAALRMVLPDASEEAADTVELIALRERIPTLTLKARHVGQEWNVYDSQYGGSLDADFSKAAVHNSSFGHVDVVIYPQIEYSNAMLDRFWSVALWLAPAVETTLWPGSKVTAQLSFLLCENFPGNQFKNHVTPGYVSLEQQLYTSRRFDVRAALGLFSMDRNGLDLRATYHVTRTLDVGLIFGATGPWYMDGALPTLCQWDKYNYLAQVNYYEPYSRVQLDVKAGKFLFGYNGVRCDAWRHFHDRAVGVFAEHSEYSTNVGFQFNVTLGSRLLGKPRALRVRAPEAFWFSYGDTVDGNKDYNYRGTSHFRTSASQPYTTDYWQPELIRRYVEEALK